MFNFLRRAQGQTPPLAEIVAGVAAGRIALVDVREAGEIRATGKASGAVAIPLAVLTVKADPLAPDALLAPGRPVAVYCASGGRSGMAAQVLRRMGYETVWNIGGLRDWQAAGGPVERG